MIQVIATGACVLGVICMLWALRLAYRARTALKFYHDRTRENERVLTETKSVLGAHPGIILVWQDSDSGFDDADIPIPAIHGSSVALTSLLRFMPDEKRVDPGARIIAGLADLAARDVSGTRTTLRACLCELARDGQPFSLTIIEQNGCFLEIDGRTAGARIIVWITDFSIKWLEVSSAERYLEDARRAIARDPSAFLDMLARAPFPAWRVSETGDLQWVNCAYVKAVGGKTLDYVLEHQVMLDDKITKQLGRTCNQNDGGVDEMHHVTIDGDRRALRILSFCMSSGVGAIAFDMTEEERTRRRLDQHVKAHDEVLNHVADAVAIFDSERKLIFYNRAFAKMWDMDERFLLEQPGHGQLLDRLRERRKLPARTDYSQWRSEELSYYLDISGIAEDKWHLPDNRTLQVTRQRHLMGGLLILFKDITTELRLRTRFNGIIKAQGKALDAFHDAIAVFGSDGRLKLWNSAFAELWAIEKKNLKDQPDYDAVVEMCVPLYRDQETWKTIKYRITDPEAAARCETRGEMSRIDGSILTYITKPLPDGHTLIAFVDVSAQRAVENALRERAEAFEAADHLKTEFVKNVSYQLRSPLQTILGYGELLQTGHIDALNTGQREKVDAICEAANHLNLLIGNILDLAIVEAGKMNLDISTVDLGALIRKTVTIGVTNARDTAIEIVVDIADELGTIEADEKRIHQILFNLLSNALRFTGSGGKIVISAGRSGDMIKLNVKDNGCGIPVEEQATRFDSFTSGDQKGAGIGLSLVKHFVHLHGGNVGIKSEPGQGTEVVCWIPAVARRSEGSTPPGKLAA